MNKIKILDRLIDLGIMILCWVSVVMFMLKNMYLEVGVFLIAARLHEWKPDE